MTVAGPHSSRAPAAAASWALRPMAAADAEAVIDVVEAANAEADRQAGRPVAEHRPGQRANVLRAIDRFVEQDGPGAWVALSGDRVVGMAESIRRGGFWGLSMLFVHPDFQSQGVGRALLEAAAAYGKGVSLRMIISSSDPRAMRRYWRTGLSMHPAMSASGEVERTALPAGLVGRQGATSDLALVAEVDAGLCRSRAEDVEFALSLGASLEVVDGPNAKGFMAWHDNHLDMLGATDEETAASLLWRFLASAEMPVSLQRITASQPWAVDVAMAAGLSFQPQGAVFTSETGLPGPWLPSGWYF